MCFTALFLSEIGVVALAGLSNNKQACNAKRTPCVSRRILSISFGPFKVIDEHSPPPFCIADAIECGCVDYVQTSVRPSAGGWAGARLLHFFRPNI